MLRIVLLSIFGCGLLIGFQSAAGDTACTTCHRGHDSGPVHSGAEIDCQSCHGDGQAHLSEPSTGILRFDDETSAEKNTACLGCHGDVHPTGRSAHERAGLACTDCHSVHKAVDDAAAALPAGFERVDRASLTCAKCHDAVFAEFSGVERHRLEENAVGCTSCHDPHAAPAQALLGGFNDAACGNCHAAQDGPFVFEHAASRVDGCSACHSPHGNPNRHLLAHQQVGELCYSCHATVPQFHTGFAPVGPPRFGTDSVCTNCHVTIHGSNFDPNFLK